MRKSFVLNTLMVIFFSVVSIGCQTTPKEEIDAVESIGVHPAADGSGSAQQIAPLIAEAWRLWKTKQSSEALTAANQALDLCAKLEATPMNDCAVGHYIVGMIHKEKQNDAQARASFRQVIDGYPTAFYPPDVNYPYYRNITERADDQLQLMDTPYDFGNYTGATLTIKAWKSWDQKDWEGAKLYTEKCIKLYAPFARQMQKEMTDFSPDGFIPYFWAVNDVGTSTFILGMVYEELNDIDMARQMYQTVIDDYGYARCWNPEGFYWKVAEACEKRLAELKDR